MITILALVGALDAGYLLKKKVRRERLACPLGGEGCNAVLHSRYGRLLGFPNEAVGLGFYVLVLAAVLASLAGVGEVAGVSVLLLVQVAALLAVLASLFLFSIQAFVIRAWCEYCLLSIGVNVAIALLISFW